MDPKETLTKLLQAIHDGDRRMAQDHSYVLSQWFGRQGFLPSPTELAEVCAKFTIPPGS